MPTKANLHSDPPPLAQKYGLMSEVDAKRLKAFEKENSELKKMYAEGMLGIKMLKETIKKNYESRSSP